MRPCLSLRRSSGVRRDRTVPEPGASPAACLRPGPRHQEDPPAGRPGAGPRREGVATTRAGP